MTLPIAPMMTRRSALAAALAAVAWRPALAVEDANGAQADALHVLNRLAFGILVVRLLAVLFVGGRFLLLRLLLLVVFFLALRILLRLLLVLLAV